MCCQIHLMRNMKYEKIAFRQPFYTSTRMYPSMLFITIRVKHSTTSTCEMFQIHNVPFSALVLFLLLHENRRHFELTDAITKTDSPKL